jgi:hypothetical protein
MSAKKVWGVVLALLLGAAAIPITDIPPEISQRSRDAYWHEYVLHLGLVAVAFAVIYGVATAGKVFVKRFRRKVDDGLR